MNEFIRISAEAFRAYREAWYTQRPHLRALHSAGWRSGFIVNGYRPNG